MKKLIIIILIIPIVSFSQNNDLNKTKVFPHIKGEICIDTNIVYCASFQYAWNNLKESIIGQPIKLSNSPKYIDNLNTYDTKNIIDNKYLYVKSGFGKDNILTTINKEISEKFDKKIEITHILNQTDIVTVAYLEKRIEFRERLDDYLFDKSKLLKFKDQDVKFFGKKYCFYHERYPVFHILHDYKNDDDFIYQVFTKDTIDEVFLAKVEPQRTLEETYNLVMDRVRTRNISNLTTSDKLIIPYLDFNKIGRFTDLEGKKFLNKGFTTYFMMGAIQMIKFSLTDRGISLDSFDYIYETEGMAFPERNIIFDKPFLLILKQKNCAKPYFLLWVANTELMTKI